jgi:hypothetical protein
MELATQLLPVNTRSVVNPLLSRLTAIKQIYEQSRAFQDPSNVSISRKGLQARSECGILRRAVRTPRNHVVV